MSALDTPVDHRLAYERLHDPLTGLPNRLLFDDHIARVVGRVRRYGSSAAVFALGVGDRGAVEDAQGVDEGNRLVVAAARRLQAGVRSYDAVARSLSTLARVGNDEFLVLCEHVDGPVAATEIAERLISTLATPTTDGDDVAVIAAVGIAMITADEADPLSRVADAQTAAGRAKRTAGATYEFFDDDLRSEFSGRAEMRRDLQRAIAEEQFVLHYQPKVLIESGQILAAEALVRWQHPERGLVPPLEFIPLAEETGLIVPLGAWVLQESCRQAAQWAACRPDRGPVMVCVNVSARQFRTDLLDCVRTALDASGLAASSLCLELTESVVMDDVDEAITILRGVKGLGVKVSIDDFGTGYSSLAHLKRLPIDELKIDRSFVAGLGTDPDDTSITAAVTAMAHALGLVVVAEGVETALQLGRLQAMGCDIAQGYYFSRPVAAAAMTDLLLAGHARPGERADDVQTIVIADDAPEVLQLAAVSLSTAGFEVHEASDGQAALDLARRVRPDCLVLDVQMPRLSGYDVCRAVRADPLLSSCTLLLLTASAESRDKVEGYTAGADDYLVKPFTPRDLVARVRHAMLTRQTPRPA